MYTLVIRKIVRLREVALTNMLHRKLLFILLFGWLLTSCSPEPILITTKSQNEEPLTTDTISPADIHSVEWLAWKAGPHAAGYDLGKGPNTYCARCHSPMNWDPAAQIDPPPNCVSCKFPQEEDVRIAEGNPLIPESNWQGVSCGVCHPQGIETTDIELGWFNKVTGYTEAVTSTTDLCEKCHHNTDTLRYQVDLGIQTHIDFTCTDCHEPHSARASCGNNGCHEDVISVMAINNPVHLGVSENAKCLECHTQGMDEHTMYVKEQGSDDCLNCHLNLIEFLDEPSVKVGHTIYHRIVSCSACHDATGAALEQSINTDQWTAIRQVEVLGRTKRVEITSHNLEREVDCIRCHFDGNSEELPVDIFSK